jgi:ABC-type Na+ efflux pump permease subunit
MLLAGMVLSNLMEEKGNKVIEILAAAIPMESVFLGKLFAMLAISFVGIGVWAISGAALSLAGWLHIPELVTPAVGWPCSSDWAWPISPWPIWCWARSFWPSGQWPIRCARSRR